MATRKLTHLDERGNARMVDVGHKERSDRAATAAGFVRMRAATVEALREGKTPKGDVLAVARVAGIQAAKRTAELIPMCHALQITSVQVELDLQQSGVAIRAAVKAADRTGVEMEALTAVSIAALTLYDMLKALDKTMTIEDIKLLKKTGGKSGDFERRERARR